MLWSITAISKKKEQLLLTWKQNEGLEYTAKCSFTA